MFRHAVALTALAGCNLVFGVDHEVKPGVCGPYAVVEQLAFDDDLKDVREVSFAGDGTRGMAHADYKGTMGPFALKLDGGTWTIDEARSIGLETLEGARLQSDGLHAFGWTGSQLDEYQFTDGVGWNALIGVIDTGTDADKRAGNVIELPIASGALRLLVETRIYVTGGSELLLRSRRPTDVSWQSTRYLEAFASAQPAITPSVGLLTANGDRLVYAAEVGGQHGSRLYATWKNTGASFDPGTRLDIDGVDDDVALTDPWINADCSELWFDADGAILHARSLAAPDPAQ